MGQVLALPKRIHKTKPQNFAPDDFYLSDDLIEWTEKKAEHMNIEEEHEKFHDHEFKRKYTDWDRCWKNWVYYYLNLVRSSRPIEPENILDIESDPE